MGQIEFKLPDIGEGVAEGEITSWKVQPGDVLEEDQVMVEVMTDKATVEIGSPVDGKVVEIKAQEGDTVPVGDVIIVLAAGEAAEAGGSGGERGAGRAEASEGSGSAGGGEAPASEAPAPTSRGSRGDSDASRESRGGSDAGARSDASATGGDGDSGDGEEIDFALPDIGEGVAEGEITKWLVKEGDAVTEDQPMVEVMTDKATVEIGSPVDGTVLRLLHPEGATVPVGEVLLVLGAGEGESARPVDRSEPSRTAAPSGGADAGRPSDGDARRPRRSAARATDTAAAGGSRPSAPATAVREAPARATTLSDTGLPSRPDGTRRVRAAPAVRRLAREYGLDISQLEGSGPNGRITMDDVRSARSAAAAPAKTAPAAPERTAPTRPSAPRRPASGPAASPAAVSAPRPHDLEGDERVPLRGLRKRIAAQMRLAKQVAAHFSYVEEVDVTELVALRREGKAAAEAQGTKLTYMPFIIRATSIALREFPMLNASLDEEAQELVHHRAIHMGFAADTPNGLIVPVIRDADRKTLLELSREVGEKGARARDGKTTPDDVGGGTFTITNAGNIGGLLATPIINVPEVAILGVHAIRRRPWVVDDEIVIRDIMYLSLSLDHRVVDGADGARFMNRVRDLLESPSLMLLES